METGIGERCSRCFVPVTRGDPGEPCATCRRVVHITCDAPPADSNTADPCPACGVATRCDFCEQAGTAATPCFIYLQKSSAGIGSVTSRWVNLRCRCCESCYRKGRRVRWSGIIGLAIMFGIPIFLCGGGGFLMDELFGEDGVMPDGLFGVPGMRIANGFMLVASVLSLLGFVFAIPMSGMIARRRIKGLVTPELDERLRKIAGVSRWGATANFTPRRDIPYGESSVPLR